MYQNKKAKKLFKNKEEEKSDKKKQQSFKHDFDIYDELREIYQSDEERAEQEETEQEEKEDEEGSEYLPEQDEQQSSGEKKQPKVYSQWDPSQDQQLELALQNIQTKDWNKIAQQVTGKNATECLQRYRQIFSKNYSKNKKRPWTEAEDQLVIQLVKKYGPQKWTYIADCLPGRIGKQCRERWHNHLNPDINKGPWNDQEEWILFLCHKLYGPKWAEIASFLEGRSDNTIKNHWNSSMKKRLMNLDKRYKSLKEQGGFAAYFPKVQCKKEQDLLKQLFNGKAQDFHEIHGLSQENPYSKKYKKMKYELNQQQMTSKYSVVLNEKQSPSKFNQELLEDIEKQSVTIEDQNKLLSEISVILSDINFSHFIDQFDINNLRNDQKRANFEYASKFLRFFDPQKLNNFLTSNPEFASKYFQPSNKQNFQQNLFNQQQQQQQQQQTEGQIDQNKTLEQHPQQQIAQQQQEKIQQQSTKSTVLMPANPQKIPLQNITNQQKNLKNNSNKKSQKFKQMDTSLEEESNATTQKKENSDQQAIESQQHNIKSKKQNNLKNQQQQKKKEISKQQITEVIADAEEIYMSPEKSSNKKKVLTRQQEKLQKQNKKMQIKQIKNNQKQQQIKEEEVVEEEEENVYNLQDDDFNNSNMEDNNDEQEQSEFGSGYGYRTPPIMYNKHMSLRHNVENEASQQQKPQQQNKQSNKNENNLVQKKQQQDHVENQKRKKVKKSSNENEENIDQMQNKSCSNNNKDKLVTSDCKENLSAMANMIQNQHNNFFSQIALKFESPSRLLDLRTPDKLNDGNIFTSTNKKLSNQYPFDLSKSPISRTPMSHRNDLFNKV